MAQALYSPSGWDDLAEALDDAALGRRHRPGRLADSYLGVADFGAYFAVNCLDAGGPTSTVCWPRPRRRTRRPPTSVRPSSTTTSGAASGRSRPTPLPVPSRGEDLPPVLVVSTVGDPATPYESGVAVADHLATGVLLTYEGDGHTIAFSGSDCVDDAVVRYLVELTPPDDGTRCPA